MGAEGIPTTTMVAKLFPDMVDVLLTQRHRLKTAGYDGFSAVFPCMTDKILNMTELLNRRSVERQFENIPAMLLVSRTLFNLSSIWFWAQKYRANYTDPGSPEKSGRRELAPKMPRETRSSVLKNLSTSLSNMLHHFQSMERVAMNTDLAYVIVNTELAYKMIEASMDSDTRRALCSPTLPESKCGCRGACGCLSLSRMPWNRSVRAIADASPAHNWPATTAVAAPMMVNPLVAAARFSPEMKATV